MLGKIVDGFIILSLLGSLVFSYHATYRNGYANGQKYTIMFYDDYVEQLKKVMESDTCKLPERPELPKPLKSNGF